MVWVEELLVVPAGKEIVLIFSVLHETNKEVGN
jgi:hypothetical protein